MYILPLGYRSAVAIALALLVAPIFVACNAPEGHPIPRTISSDASLTMPTKAFHTPMPSPMPISTPAPSPTPRPPVIFLDAGHGGKDPGTVHRGKDGKVDLIEKDLNLDVANRTGRLLQERGFTVVHARETDTLLTPFDGPDDRLNRRNEMQARVDKANQANADLYISIHFNGYNDPAIGGTEVYYCADRPFAAQSKRLAELVLQSILRELAGIGYKAVNRGVRDDYGVRPWRHFFALGPDMARPSKMPGIVAEPLFVTNDVEAALLRRDETRQAIARAYAQAVVAYFQPSPQITPTRQSMSGLNPLEATPVATTAPLPTPTVPPELVRGDPARPEVALTFDAGASSEPTPAILDALKSAGVTATMFLTGEWIRQNQALVRRIVAEGHQVANHTFNHPDLRNLKDSDIVVLCQS